MRSGKSIATALAAVLLIVAGFNKSADASLRETAGPFVVDLGNRVIDVFTDSRASKDEKADRFRILFHEGFAVKALAMFTLGRYSNDADPEFMSEYLQIFDDYIVLSYVARFSGSAAPEIKVLDIVPDTDGKGKEVGVRVRTHIWQGDARPVEVVWRIREYKGQPIIVDVLSQGVSLAVTQQNEFTAVISNNGGDLRALLKVLRDKNKEMRDN